MSKRSRFLGRGVVPLALLAAGLAFGPGTASAASVQLDGVCKYPIYGGQPVKLTVSGTFPERVSVGLSVPEVAVDVELETDFFTNSLALVEDPSETVEGTASVTYEINHAGATSQVVTKVPFGAAAMPKNPNFLLPLTGSSTLPPVAVKDYSPVQYSVKSFGATLRFVDDAGQAVILPPVTRDLDGNPVPQSDADPETVDIFCKIVPATQATTLAVVRPQEPICTDNLKPPTTPGAVVMDPADIGRTTVTLNWIASTRQPGPCPNSSDVDGYRVIYDGKTVELPFDTTATTIFGLTPATDYTFRIYAVSVYGVFSEALVVKATTKPPLGGQVVKYSYGLTGSAGLKTLSKGLLPITGGIDADLTVATGAFSADLVLNQTQGRLIAAGFLPVTAKIGFVPSGKTTGTLLDGVLEATSRVRIKVQEVKLFGAIPLAGGNNCQTKSLSEIKLKSTAEFKPLQGGILAGTFAISDLNGCGVLNGLVSPLTAGGGNSLALKLTPKVASAS
ncbi:MAG: fibronectin type III domain-containing protein [Solirubrobacteraceae bacterium]|nr:fibronectin type III domain-containing protein [Solirubrobacteraceae bacterium]